MFLSKTMLEKTQREALSEESVQKVAQVRRKRGISTEKINQGDEDLQDSDNFDKVKYKTIKLSLDKILKDSDGDTKKSE